MMAGWREPRTRPVMAAEEVLTYDTESPEYFRLQ